MECRDPHKTVTWSVAGTKAGNGVNAANVDMVVNDWMVVIRTLKH
jgi:hypothetical protein